MFVRFMKIPRSERNDTLMKKIKIIIGIIIALAVSAFHGYGVWSLPLYNTRAESATYKNVAEISGNTIVGEEFTCNANGLCGFEFRPSFYGRQITSTASYRVIENSSKKVIREGEINPTTLIENKKNLIDFEKITDSKNKVYTIEIQDNNAAPGDSMTLLTAEKSSADSSLTVNGQASETLSKSALVMKAHVQYFKFEEFLVFLALIGYVVFFIRFLNKFLK